MMDKDNNNNNDDNVTIYTETSSYYHNFRNSWEGRSKFMTGRTIGFIFLFLIWSLILGVLTNIYFVFQFVGWLLGGLF